MKERGKKVLALIPVDLDGHLFTAQWQSGKAQQVRSRVAANFQEWRDHDKFETEVERIAANG